MRTQNPLEMTVFNLFKPNRQIREDRKYLDARARRLLKGYLSADAIRKQRYYEAISGAAAACDPDVSNPGLKKILSSLRPQPKLLSRLSNYVSTRP
jgi:hypothetical protein